MLLRHTHQASQGRVMSRYTAWLSPGNSSQNVTSGLARAHCSARRNARPRHRHVKSLMRRWLDGALRRHLTAATTPTRHFVLALDLPASVSAAHDADRGTRLGVGTRVLTAVVAAPLRIVRACAAVGRSVGIVLSQVARRSHVPSRSARGHCAPCWNGASWSRSGPSGFSAVASIGCSSGWAASPGCWPVGRIRWRSRSGRSSVRLAAG